MQLGKEEIICGRPEENNTEFLLVPSPGARLPFGILQEQICLGLLREGLWRKRRHFRDVVLAAAWPEQQLCRDKRLQLSPPPVLSGGTSALVLTLTAVDAAVGVQESPQRPARLAGTKQLTSARSPGKVGKELSRIEESR